jgi:hypothetical protein
MRRKCSLIQYRGSLSSRNHCHHTHYKYGYTKFCFICWCRHATCFNVNWLFSWYDGLWNGWIWSWIWNVRLWSWIWSRLWSWLRRITWCDLGNHDNHSFRPRPISFRSLSTGILPSRHLSSRLWCRIWRRIWCRVWHRLWSNRLRTNRL